jgi:hypothetical protein
MPYYLLYRICQNFTHIWFQHVALIRHSSSGELLACVEIDLVGYVYKRLSNTVDNDVKTYAGVCAVFNTNCLGEKQFTVLTLVTGCMFLIT